MKDISSAFLLPASDHQLFRDKKIEVLDIDYGIPSNRNNIPILKLGKELMDKAGKAVNTFYPDLIVEDFDFFCGILCSKYKIPRISIRRTGLFRSTNPLNRNTNHFHSIEKDPSNGKIHRVLHFKRSSRFIENDSELLDEGYYFPKLKSLTSLPDSFVKSPVNVIPGVPSIEKLPPIKNQGSYFYSGPLNAKDNPTEALKKNLNEFFEQNRTRKKVLVTTGLIERQDISEIITYLSERDYAIVTTVPYQGLILKTGRLFFNSTLPLNFVCSAVDLVVHHCGSGMYHYPLLHLKPTITIGTQCYDREEVALQLEAMGISAHTPAPQDDPHYLEVFKTHLERFEKGSLCDFDKLENIREEIIDTMLSFDVEKVIDYTLDL